MFEMMKYIDVIGVRPITFAIFGIIFIVMAMIIYGKETKFRSFKYVGADKVPNSLTLIFTIVILCMFTFLYMDVKNSPSDTSDIKWGPKRHLSKTTGKKNEEKAHEFKCKENQYLSGIRYFVDYTNSNTGTAKPVDKDIVLYSSIQCREFRPNFISNMIQGKNTKVK